MTAVYLAGYGLACGIGGDLQQALQALQRPVVPQQRTIRGLDRCVPYHMIDGDDSPSWHARCQMLVRRVVAEAGTRARTGTLYLASSSVNVGAMETDEPHAGTVPEFLRQLTAMLDWIGPVVWINTACTSALSAVLVARDALLAGDIDEALIIGLELENRLTLAGFAGMQLLSAGAARPFAADRDGLVLGEAVAALRLSRQPARWRIAGGAQVIDSRQASGASSTAYRTMLAQTLAQAAWRTSDIDLIKVQAAGSIANDAVEAHALREFFDAMPALVSLKPPIGHTLGASGAAELALLLTILAQQQWPPATGSCDAALGVTLGAHRPPRLRHMLACILGFGGSHACVAIEDCHA